MPRGAPAVETLLQALRQQLDSLLAYTARIDGLITALVSADFAAVQAAVAAQTMALGQVEAAERRRQAGEAAVIHALTGRMPAPGAPRGTVTITALLKRLPPREAEALSALRREMLLALQGLQTRQRQATTLVRTAQTVSQRTALAAGIIGAGYGPRGEQALIEQTRRRQQGRWA